MIVYFVLFKCVNISTFIMSLMHRIILIFVYILKIFSQKWHIPQEYFLEAKLLNTFQIKEIGSNIAFLYSQPTCDNYFFSQTWKTRWFTLHRNELKYFKDQMVRNVIIHFPFKNQLSRWKKHLPIKSLKFSLGELETSNKWLEMWVLDSWCEESSFAKTRLVPQELLSWAAWTSSQGICSLV